MALHFSEAELQQRRDRVCEELRQRGLHAMLCFRQETDFYLTGYDTFGYCFFQCLVLCADGRLVLLTRAPDLRQAQNTSIIKDIRVWVDSADSNPSKQLVELLDEFGCRGKKLGIEFDAYGLTAAIWRQLETEIHGFCELHDTSDIVTTHRTIKSDSEIAYVRRAAELADAAWDAAMPLIKPEAWEGDILAAMHSAIFCGGGDYSGNEFVIGAGDDALLCRYFSGRKHLKMQDQLTLEWAGVYRRYHAAMMRTVIVGEASEEHYKMHRIAIDAMEACEDALKPGIAIGEMFDIHARIADAGGLKNHRMNACGYSLGTTYAPTWMDKPMLYHGNQVIAKPNMVFFIHIVFVNSDNQHAMTVGHTVRVSDDGCERLSRASLDMLVAG